MKINKIEKLIRLLLIGVLFFGISCSKDEVIPEDEIIEEETKTEILPELKDYDLNDDQPNDDILSFSDKSIVAFEEEKFTDIKPNFFIKKIYLKKTKTN